MSAQQALEDRLTLMHQSGERFDQGNKLEALNLSLSIRILVHDTKISTSILEELGIKGSIKYPDTCPPIPVQQGNMYPQNWCGLAPFDMGITSGDPGYFAKLSTAPIARWLDFDDWWEQIVYDSFMGHQLTRKQFVLNMAHKDGGAHFDLNGRIDAYEKAARIYNSHVFLVDSKGNEQQIPPVAPFAVRQIAHELLEALIDDYKVVPNRRMNYPEHIFGAGLHIVPEEQEDSNSG